MTVRAVLIAALMLVGALSVPMVAAAQAPQSTESADIERSRVNMAVLDRFYDALSANDGATVADLLTGARVWRGGEGALFVDRGPYESESALLEGVFGRVDRRFEYYSAYRGRYLNDGDRAVALGYVLLNDELTGGVVEVQFAHVFTFRDGEIASFEQFADTAQMMDAVAPD